MAGYMIPHDELESYSPLDINLDNAMYVRDKRMRQQLRGGAPIGPLPDPGWDAMFGGLNRAKEIANANGQDFRLSTAGLGRQGDDMKFSDLDYAPRMNALNEYATDLATRFRLSQAAVREGNARATDTEDAVRNASTDRQHLDFAFADPKMSRDEILARLPGHMRASADAFYQSKDKARADLELAERKQTETERAARANEAIQANGLLTDDAITQTAKRYLETGVMPPLGMGDKTTRQRVLNRAAQLDPSSNVAANSAGFRADSGSLAALQKSRDAIAAFEHTAARNIDVFLETAGKVVDTGSPIANISARLVSGKMLGSPDQAAYDAARLVAVNEIAKITSNPNLTGQLSDSARHEVEMFNPREATLKQTVAVMRILKADMANRITSLDEQLAQTRARVGTATAKPEPSGKPSGGTVQMIAPDGRQLNVPAADVERLTALGAKKAGG